MKVNSNTIELTVHTSYYCILGLLCSGCSLVTFNSQIAQSPITCPKILRNTMKLNLSSHSFSQNIRNWLKINHGIKHVKEL